MTDIAHFTKADTLVNYILPDMKLRASNLERLNDPLENKWGDSSCITVRLDATTPRQTTEDTAKISMLNQQLPKFIRIACFSSYAHPEYKSETLPEPHLNMRMWAQYGENHEGACLIFDSETIDKKIKSSLKDFHIKTSEVAYNNDFIGAAPLNIISINTSISDITSHYHQEISDRLKIEAEKHILTKRKEWRDELEIRAVFYSPNTDSLYIPIEDCIKKIYFGINANEETIEKTKKYSHQIPLYKLEIDEPREELTETLR